MSNNINNVPPIKKNITSQKKPEEESKQKKKSKSQIKYIKNIKNKCKKYMNLIRML